MTLFVIAQKFAKYLHSFGKNFFYLELSKIAESGHTGYDKKHFPLVNFLQTRSQMGNIRPLVKSLACIANNFAKSGHTETDVPWGHQCSWTHTPANRYSGLQHVVLRPYREVTRPKASLNPLRERLLLSPAKLIDE